MPTIQSAPVRSPSLPIASFEQSSPPPAPAGWPLLRLGFRPFYLGAAIFAALAVPAWLVLFFGHASLRSGMPPLYWHAHEMLFGFAAAVVIGFLLTAGKAWTGLPTPRGTPLGALAALWAAARVLAITGPYAIYAVFDAALLPIVAAVFASLLLRARNRRNLPLAAILGLLAAANIVFHLSVLGLCDISPLRPLHAALALIVIIECVIAGRVIPSFTANATPGLRLKPQRATDWAATLASGLALALWVFDIAGPISALLFAIAAVLQLVRQWGWKPWVTRDRPILWILEAAYAWIAVAFMLLAAAQLGLIAPSFGLHALAVGATAGLIMGMITRTARGHTGRALKPSKPEVLAYVLVLAAAGLRVLVAMIPQAYAGALMAAAIAWTAAFAIYLIVYTPWLTRTRVDGKDG